jgi:[ribosomal protein S5]-alanine N-acetyltransferase
MEISTIKAKKFTLRPFRKGDEFSIVKHINDRVVSRNTLSIPYPYTLQDAKKWLAKTLKNYKKKDLAALSFAIDIDGKAVGSIGFSSISGHKASFGYWLGRKYWNNGIMTEAIKLATDFGFSKLKLKRIYARVYPFNKPSMRVLEKNKFKREGTLEKEVKKKGKFLDAHLYAKVK